MFKKGLAVGIIVLFIGLAIAPNMYANASKTTNTTPNNEKLQNKIVTITCNYCTLKGIEKIEKEITVEEYESLSELFNGTDVDTIVFELNKLGLLPKTMSVQQAKELISGEYGKKQFERYVNKIHSSSILENTDFYEGYFCFVKGSAPVCEIVRLMQSVFFSSFIFLWLAPPFLDDVFSHFSWYKGFFWKLWDKLWSGYDPLAWEIAEFILYPRHPRFLMAFGFMNLYNGEFTFRSITGGKVELKGENIELSLFGFFGLICAFKEINGEISPSGKFMGFSIYTIAR